ncbi:unnamed protein product [Clonostachys byssicola]|uniref:Uncharacterized protein n=1 Tax=Clonostachys byssicola TaxID=160290 RepID=A0A9N9TZ68_9HYPO|nr:unnamed protein product [Clonostachys byssicola]
MAPPHPYLAWAMAAVRLIVKHGTSETGTHQLKATDTHEGKAIPSHPQPGRNHVGRSLCPYQHYVQRPIADDLDELLIASIPAHM